MPKPKFILTKENYFTPENIYISNSKISDYLKDPAYYKAKHVDHVIEKEITDPMIIGSAVDCWLTEGSDVFEQRYRIVSRRDKKADDYQYQLNDSMYTDIVNMCVKVESQPAYNKIKNYKKQVLLQDDSNRTCGILDFLHISKDGTAKIYDLKTSNSADPMKYHYKCIDMGYYRQMAMYDMLVRVNFKDIRNVEHYHLVIEKDPDEIYNVYTFKFNLDRVQQEKWVVLEAVCNIKSKKFPAHVARWEDAIEIGGIGL